MEDGKKLLSSQLARWLGLEDGGADDVLEMLLTIESTEDLTEYLQQFLGKSAKELEPFVGDVVRVQQGEMPVSIPPATTDDDAKPPAKPKPVRNGTAPFAASKPPQQKQNKNASPKNPNPKIAAKQPQRQGNAPNASKQSKPNISALSANPTKPPPEHTQQQQSQKNPKPEIPSKPLPPPERGTPNVVCGCFGNMHKPLHNCLYCGRISCQEEGYDFCAFCGYRVTPKGASSSQQQHAAAWKHKEQLLRYDRETAQRTVVVDDQADYYNTTSYQWLANDEERAAADEQARQQYAAFHERQKMQFKLG